jgi:hypothetical protein
MNVEIGAEATLFPEKEYINGIAVAVCSSRSGCLSQHEDAKNVRNMYKCELFKEDFH